MRIIGLTGGIGSGKSTVADFLAEMGAVLLNADEIGHEALLAGTDICSRLTGIFGEGVCNIDGSINRKKLGKIVFRSEDDLCRLNEIVHPWIREELKERIETYRREGNELLVLEAALLIEAGWTDLVDEVWVTVATETEVLRRLRLREAMPPEEAHRRIDCQLPVEDRIKHADVIIDTNCTFGELKEKVVELWKKLLQRID